MISSLLSGAGPHVWMRRAAVALAGVLLLTVSAKVQIPFWPVPMTLQTAAVMAIALAVPPRAALVILGAYLAAGALGLPVFAGTPERGIGLAYMAGPTGGYLAGYFLAAGLTSALARGRGIVGRIAAMVAGLALVYALGLAWLAAFLPVRALLAQGFLPFILGDLVKIAMVGAVSAALPSRVVGDAR